MDHSHITITWAGTPLYKDGSKLTRARSRHQRKLADPLRRITLDEEMARAIFKHAGPEEPRIYLQGDHTYEQILAIIEALK